MNWEALANGTAEATQWDELRQYLEVLGVENINAITSELREGIFTSLETALPDLKLSDSIK
jgi:hypothetical protein